MSDRVPLLRDHLPPEEEGHAMEVMRLASEQLSGFVGVYWADRCIDWPNLGPSDSDHYYAIYPPHIAHSPVYFYGLKSRTSAPNHERLARGIRHFQRTFSTLFRRDEFGSAILIRGGSIIRLSGEILSGRIYFQEAASAHEILEEIEGLERGFPGRFAINL